MQQIKWKRLIASIFICELAGITGAVFTIPSIPQWYGALAKPVLTPPAWVFSPVWTLLYALMGVALYLVWNTAGEKQKSRNTILVFGLQLALNVLWSIAFFGLHNILAALAVIGLLWLSIAATIALFYRISRPAGLILLPYLLWVSFAAYLNYMIWALNA